MHDQSMKTALLLGASGLVGAELLQKLLKDERYNKITCLLRRPLQGSLNAEYGDKLQPIVVEFDNLQDYEGYFAVDHVYVCLGTTIKKAKSKAAFRKVDFEYVHAAAQLARAQHAKGFVWISSVGADSKSGNFYLRVKGELEDSIFSMNGLDHAATVRPSLLLGDRQESRFGEQLGIMFGKCLSPLMMGPLAKYRPIEAATVAKQMIALQFSNS